MTLKAALAILFAASFGLLLSSHWEAGAFVGFAAIVVALLAPDDARADARRRNPRSRHMAHPMAGRGR